MNQGIAVILTKPGFKQIHTLPRHSKDKVCQREDKNLMRISKLPSLDSQRLQDLKQQQVLKHQLTETRDEISNWCRKIASQA